MNTAGDCGGKSFELIVQAMPSAAIAVDREGRILAANVLAERMFGYGPGEIVGISVEELVPQDLRGNHIAHRANYAKNPEQRAMGWGRDLVARRKDGSHLSVEIALNPVGPDADVVVCDIVDISARKKIEDDLRKSEEIYRLLVHDVRDYAICVLDPGGYVRLWNTGAELLSGYHADEVIGRLFSHWFEREEDKGRAVALLAKAAETGRAEDEGWRIRKDGSRFWASGIITALRNEHGQLTGFSKVVRDRTAHKNAEEALRESERLLRQVIDLVPHTIFAKDRFGRFLFANAACAGRLGTTPDAIVGRSQLDLTPSREQAERWLAEDLDVITSGLPKFIPEEYDTDRQGYKQVLQTNKVPLRLSSGETAVLGVAVDITERKRMEDELVFHALHDPLTRLPNRHLFLEHLEHAFHKARRNGTKFAVLFLDLDRFKVVNDSLGHLAGDELLVMAASRIAESTRDADTFARFGGDEFAVLLEDLRSVEEAGEVAERIQSSLRRAFPVNGRELYTTACVGIAPYTRDAIGPKELLRNADAALYRAKSLGPSSRAVFDTAMHQEAMELLNLEADLRRAAERGEFDLHYQEIRALATETTVGFEALLRWRHPHLGLRLPCSFLGVADELGVLAEIGWWVLDRACRQVRDWVDPASGAPVWINVNVCGKQFSDPTLVERVAQTVRACPIDPDRLKLEITETAVMENAPISAARVRELSQIGVGVSIDDFGTGHSSLSRLLTLPIASLKIDRSFIDGMKPGCREKPLAESIVQLAHGLGLKVVAEGVETIEQLRHLQAVGCDYGQGYLFSRPVTADEARSKVAVLGVLG